MLRVPQVRTFLNLLPPSEGDVERFDATQSLEVCLLFPSVYIPRLTLFMQSVLGDGRLVCALRRHCCERPAQLWHCQER
jgi:hypothetical protein